jgi:hypothetical protein
MSIEAMKLALEALDIAQGILADARSYHRPKMLAAYTAIKQALAAPVQPVADAMNVVTEAMQKDPDYAWSWHCNIAMAFVDAGGDHYTGNQGAARFMKTLANVEPAHELPTPPAAPVQEQEPEQESVGNVEALRHSANEWADMAANGLQWVRNIAEGISETQEALSDLEANLVHCREVNDRREVQAFVTITQPAAPVQEPVAWVEVKDTNYGPYEFHGKELLPVGKHDLYAAAQPAQQEPDDEKVDCPRCGHCCPQRQPLTNEQIGKILDDPNIAEKHQGNWLVLPYAYARAIETAHNIKE